MKKATFELAMNLKNSTVGVSKITWSGYQTSVPGLVVCREPWRNAGKWYPGDVWQVIHEESGYAVGACRIWSRTMAVNAAEALGKLGVDWTGSIGRLTRDKELKGRVRAALKGVGL